MAGYHQQPHQLPQQPGLMQHQPGGQQPMQQMMYQQQQVPGGQIQRTPSNTNMAMGQQQMQQQPMYMSQGQQQPMQQLGGGVGGGGGGGGGGGIGGVGSGTHPAAINPVLSTPSVSLSNQSSPAVPMVGGQSTPLSSQMSTGGPLSVGHPGSNPQTPMQGNPGSANPMPQQSTPLSQQPSVAGQSSSSSGSEQPPLPADPIALVKQLIIKDLRQSLIELNKSAAEVIKQKTKLVHAAENMNPASVINPMSVNPLSVNPASVKSIDNDPKSVDNRSPEKPVKPTTPNEQFLNGYDQFFAVCDQVEKQFMLLQESCKQAKSFDKLVPPEVVNRMVQQAGDINTYLPHAQGYVDSSDKLLRAITRCIDSVAEQYEATRSNHDAKLSDNSMKDDSEDDVAMETGDHLSALDDQ